MKNKNWLLAYCSVNQEQAAQFDKDLSRAGISFVHYTCDPAQDVGYSLGKDLLKTEGQIFLLISDNFLRSSHCMMDALELLSKGLEEDRIQAIIIDADNAKAPNGAADRAPTRFSRISDLINYMNFWQERYLKMRKKKETIPTNQVDHFDKELKKVRIISAEVGEFLRMLRDTTYWTMKQLREDHYSLFFNKIGKQDLLVKYQSKIPEAPVLQPEEAETLVAQKQTPPPIQKEIPPVEFPPEEDLPVDPEELDDIQESHLDESLQQDTYEDLSVLFDQPGEADEPPNTSAPKEGVQDITSWDDLFQQDNFDSDVARSMTGQFFDQIDQRIEKGEEFAAAKELRQFLQVNPGSAEAHYRLATLEIDNEAYSQAREHLQQAIALQPTQPAYHLVLGRLLFHHFREEPKAAVQAFKTAIQLDPSNVDAHYEYGILQYEVLKKLKKAIVQLELTLALDPHHPFANYDLALIYYTMKKRKKAARHYEKAFQINPELRTPDNDMAFWYEEVLLGEEDAVKTKTKRKKKKKEVSSDETTVEPPPETQPEVEEEIAMEEEAIEEIELEDPILEEEPPVEDPPEEPADNAVSPAPVIEKRTASVVKTVLITGATSGIGRATAERFAREGHRLIVTGRRNSRLDDLKKTLEDSYQNEVYPLGFDVRYKSAAKENLLKLPDEWKNIDLLINNAGLAKGFDPIHEGDLRHWETMLDTNVKGLLFITRIITPGMVERGSGQIINVCSSAGHEVYPNGAVYCATKHAVDAITKGMRLDLFKHGIRVGQVSPGHVEETEFAQVRYDGDRDRAKIYEDFQPLKATDVAEAIYFMASQPPHVTIHDIQLMGTQQASNVFIDRSGRPKSKE